MLIVSDVHSPTLHVQGETRLYGAAELGPIVLKEWVNAEVDIDLQHPALPGWKAPASRRVSGSVSNFPRKNEIRVPNPSEKRL